MRLAILAAIAAVCLISGCKTPEIKAMTVGVNVNVNLTAPR